MKHKSSPKHKKKGFTPLIIIPGIILVFGIIYGIYFLVNTGYFNPKESTKLLAFPTVDIGYSSPTLGFKLTLPGNWTVCDPGYNPGVIGLQPQAISTDRCSAYTITTDRYNIYPENPALKRQPKESFFDYVIRLDAAYMQQPQVIKSKISNPKVEFRGIDAHTVLKKITTSYPQNIPVGTRRQVLYVEGAQKETLIISSNFGDFTSKEDDANLKLIASNLASIPISTGDISGQVNSVTSENNHEKTTPMPNFPVTIYTDLTDKKAIAASTKSDDSGKYVIHLKPGTYYAEYANGIKQTITVSLGGITSFNPGITPKSEPTPLTPF
ncbi:MAG: hypothetical protein PHQ59_03750 [Candidatus Daviesbacteria bacterium]|nr:hypothetical protein [Candidatus Daviesbacteria bacterium]